MSIVALEVAGLRKTYHKNGQALAILDIERFAAREGEFITIIGPSGCGKSTFLHMMGGFIPADAGAIRVYGQEVSGPGPDRGMMFQEFALSRGRRSRATSPGARGAGRRSARNRARSCSATSR